MIILMQSFESEGQNVKFMKVYENYRNLMFHIAKGILRDDYLAEDAVQEAFVSIAKNIEKIQDPSSTETRRFVAVIVRNASINMLNKRSRETIVDEMPNEEVFLSQHYDSSQDEFFSKVRCEQIVEVVRGLSPSLKDPLLLYVAHGMSTKEIATIFRISLSATHKRIQRARERIMEILREGGYDE